MAILLKAIYWFSTIPIKIPTEFFIELKKAICKFIWNNKRPRKVKVLKYKRSSGTIVIPNIKLYYNAIVIKILWYSYIDGQVDQWNGIEDPEMNSPTYGHLILLKELKPSSGKTIAFLTKMLVQLPVNM